MICQACKKAQATVHLTEIKGDQPAELHMCEACAREKGLTLDTSKTEGGPQISWIDLITSASGGEEAGEDAPALTCPLCGMTYKEFRESGRLGCPNDYVAFQAALLPLLEKVHHGVRHEGKRPAGADPETSAEELSGLHDELRLAIQKEEYEHAASIRDRIRKLESGTN